MSICNIPECIDKREEGAFTWRKTLCCQFCGIELNYKNEQKIKVSE
jgi:hypothetical protein